MHTEKLSVNQMALGHL